MTASIKPIFLEGLSVSTGIGIGKVNIYRTDLDDVTEYSIPAENIVDELDRYYSAIEEVNLSFLENQKRLTEEIGLKSAQIYETYNLILEDPFFKEEIPQAIKDEAKNSEFLIRRHLSKYEKHFEKIKDEYLAERIFDIRGVSRRLIYHLLQTEKPETETSVGKIIVARELTPADSIHFHHSALEGIVTEFGGKTSHAAILARSLEVPAVVGIKNLFKTLKPNSKVIIDGSQGKVIINPDKRLLEKYRTLKRNYFNRKKFLVKHVTKPITNLPDRNIEILANINEPSEVEMALKYKADGVGLYRTELQFIAKERFLTEDEQYELYADTIKKFFDKEVVIRVLDLGGDKFLPFAQLNRESNPFLGWRSIRILLSELEIFKAQLRAVFRAAIHGKASILIPMISSMEEIYACKKIIKNVKRELKGKNIPYSENVNFGIMIEIPSAAIMVDKMIQQVDFLSIGTNDLIQYTLAVDRNNEKVAHFYQPLNKAVLTLIKKVAQAGKKYNKPVSVCGEMAGEPLYIQLLLSLGIDKFSMQPSAIPLIKNIVINTDTQCLNDINNMLDENGDDYEALKEFLEKKIIHFC